MDTEYFVEKDSIVRQIWGKSDTILFVFAGAAAEFALNKAVDWLYFTGRLPKDPIGRLFSTVSYAQAIIFSEKQSALKAIDSMVAVHSKIESKRGATIPDWAYRDVLFMLIDYSVRSFELLERRLTMDEKKEIFNVFYNLGVRMKLTGLPVTFKEWKTMREEHIKNNLEKSRYTVDLFNQYKKHLGTMRYRILWESQTLVAPPPVKKLLGFHKISLFYPLVVLYKLFRQVKIDWLIKMLILPAKYKLEVKRMDWNPVSA